MAAAQGSVEPKPYLLTRAKEISLFLYCSQIADCSSTCPTFVMARKLFLAVITVLTLFLVGSFLPRPDATKGALKVADTILAVLAAPTTQGVVV